MPTFSQLDWAAAAYERQLETCLMLHHSSNWKLNSVAYSISSNLKSLRVSQMLVRWWQMWPLPFWKSSWSSQLRIQGHFTCRSVTCWTAPWISVAVMGDEYTVHLEEPLSICVASQPFLHQSEIFQYFLCSYFILLPAALHSFCCIYIPWLAYFTQTFLDFIQHLLCWLTHSIPKLSLLPCSFTSEILHVALRQCMRSIHPPTSLLVLRRRAEAGKQPPQLDLETPPHYSDSCPSLGQGHRNCCNCLFGNTLIQYMVQV